MSATYVPSLPTDTDHIRFLIGDTNTSNAKLSDEEIQAVASAEGITGAALKYYAAASCLNVLMTRWAAKGEGVMSKAVPELSVSWGISGTSLQVLQARIAELRAMGSRALLAGSTKPYDFRML